MNPKFIDIFMPILKINWSIYIYTGFFEEERNVKVNKTTYLNDANSSYGLLIVRWDNIKRAFLSCQSKILIKKIILNCQSKRNSDKKRYKCKNVISIILWDELVVHV